MFNLLKKMITLSFICNNNFNLKNMIFWDVIVCFFFFVENKIHSAAFGLYLHIHEIFK
jgi:hypothetical protein